MRRIAAQPGQETTQGQHSLLAPSVIVVSISVNNTAAGGAAIRRCIWFLRLLLGAKPASVLQRERPLCHLTPHVP